MKMVFQQKVQEKEAKLKQSEEELYARHKEMKDALDRQRGELEEKKRRLESGRPLTPEKGSVSSTLLLHKINSTYKYLPRLRRRRLVSWVVVEHKSFSSCHRRIWYYFFMVLLH